ncbi:hypothetical protein RIF29_20067 [Crotalaria pallida]|uniref:Uncharacterized protein n=1 Tax=Crotalaria pallida TaxID=3830 RepID=A0AAN9F2S3_CROPI
MVCTRKITEASLAMTCELEVFVWFVQEKANANSKQSSGGKSENVFDSFEVLEKVLGSSSVGKKFVIKSSKSPAFSNKYLAANFEHHGKCTL